LGFKDMYDRVTDMKNFTFILSSADPQLLDDAMRKVCVALKHEETQLTLNILPVKKENAGRVHQRKLGIASNDFHVLDKLRKHDIQRNVRIEGVPQ
jgi:ribosomal protein S10